MIVLSPANAGKHQNNKKKIYMIEEAKATPKANTKSKMTFYSLSAALLFVFSFVQPIWVGHGAFLAPPSTVRHSVSVGSGKTSRQEGGRDSRRAGKGCVLLQGRNDLEREIAERSNRKARGGTGETVAGAVLGGLLLGPFGALFGASIGSSIGSKNAIDRARSEEMERFGVTSDMLESARDVGIALEQSIEGLKASQQSLETQQRMAKRLENESNELYDKAKAAILLNEDNRAKDLLLQRNQIQDKLKQVLKGCIEEKKRLEKMEVNVAAIENRARDIESLLRRAVGAKALSNSDALGMSLSRSDPLLQKFKDIGID